MSFPGVPSERDIFLHSSRGGKTHGLEDAVFEAQDAVATPRKRKVMRGYNRSQS
jgi:hypothetical protein